jgi:hypothetical protein
MRLFRQRVRGSVELLLVGRRLDVQLRDRLDIGEQLRIARRLLVFLRGRHDVVVGHGLRLVGGDERVGEQRIQQRCLR